MNCMLTEFSTVFSVLSFGRWSYTIQQLRKSNQGNCFKVSVSYSLFALLRPTHSVNELQVQYAGVVARCDRPDPHYPVALEVAKSIPGLMTVISRE